MKITITNEELKAIIRDYILENYFDVLDVSSANEVEFENESKIFLNGDDLIVKKKDN